MKPKLSIIIVHYQNKKVLFNCLSSIKTHKPKALFEVIVVDNDEKPKISQEITKKFPWVKYHQSSGNIGYAAGNNLGAKLAQGKYLFILNPDTKILSGSIDKLVNFLRLNSKTAGVAPLLLNHRHKPYPLQGTSILTPLKGIFSLSFINKLFPNNPISKNYWSNWENRLKSNQPRQVDVVPGSAFLIKAQIFKKLGGFDENFFLYFEETDLGKRLKDSGFKLHILPQAKLVHRWAGSTPKSQKIKRIFAASRFYYFKKHYGIFWAFLVELFARLSIKSILLGLIVLLATWLRFYHLPETMTFIGDQGRDYLAAKEMVETGKWPLVGIPSSVPWLHQGSFFIWLIALALKLGQFNPIAPAVLTSTLGVFTVCLTFILASRWFSFKPALLACLIMATAPLAVIHSRLAYHISPIPLFSLLFLMATYHWAKSRLNLFWPVLLWSVLLQFELTITPLIFLIPLIYFWQKRKILKKDLAPFILAVIIPFIPKIIFDLTHGFKQTLGFIAWLGYRSLSFFGFSGRHTMSFSGFKTVTLTIFSFWQKFTIWGSQPTAILLVLLIIAVIIHRLNQRRPLSLKSKILFGFILINYLAFYLHQGPSEAYFPVLFPAWALLIAWLIDYLKNKYLSLLIIALAAFNTFYLITNNFISYGPTLPQRLELAKFIKLKSQGQPFKLTNHRSVVKFNSYLDNYRYLLMFLGSPEDPQAKLEYTIYDGRESDFIPSPATLIYHFSGQKLIKHD